MVRSNSMKTKMTMGAVRKLLTEAAGPTELDGFKVGNYYVLEDVNWRSEGVCKLLAIRPLNPHHPEVVMAVFKTQAGSETSQRFDVWADRVIGDATPEQAQAAEAEWSGQDDHMARTIDTSREGT